MEQSLSDTKIFGFSKMVLSSFLAGTGIILWMMNIVFLPINKIETDIALIQKDISIINSNHLTHTQDIVQTIKEIKTEQVDQQKQIIDLQKQLLVILQK